MLVIKLFVFLSQWMYWKGKLTTRTIQNGILRHQTCLDEATSLENVQVDGMSHLAHG